MEERNLESWNEFRTAIDEIRRIYGYHEYSIGNDQTRKHKNTILFRGQASAKYHLQTTLERKTNQKFTLMQYLSPARNIVPELESYMGIKWDLPDYESLSKEVVEKSDNMFGPHIPLQHYEYLVYLRHYGYPSPLLDWSKSPYIAAYFAMCDEDPEKKRVAVFVYIESINSGKDFYGEGEPTIQVSPERITTHKRHFMQQARYTIASKWEHGEHAFCSHYEIFDKQHPNQDKLIKITIPITDRKLALRDLYDFNINHFTLFQTEDSLIRVLSMKNFDID